MEVDGATNIDVVAGAVTELEVDGPTEVVDGAT